MIPTLTELAEQYIATAVPSLRATSQRETIRVLRKEVLPRIGHLPAEQIKRKDLVFQLLDQIEKPGIKRNAYCATSACYRWAMKRGLVEFNPTSGIAPPKSKPRERYLSHDELRLVWHACPHCRDYGAITRLVMLTGCRRAEVGGLTWQEVNLEVRQLELPRGRVKNNRDHIVPLSELALAQLPARRMGHAASSARRRGGMEWLARWGGGDEEAHPHRAEVGAARPPPHYRDQHGSPGRHCGSGGEGPQPSVG